METFKTRNTNTSKIYGLGSEYMKYKPLKEPCKSCIFKCFRVEDPTFVKDENCKYRRNRIREIKETLGIQERIKI